MKKTLLLGAALCMSAMSTMAYTVGAEDNTSAFWTAFSPASELVGDGTIHYEFVNYTNGATNWNNWMVCIDSSGLSPLDEAYQGADELLIIRADNWGWGPLYESTTLSNNYDWDNFTTEMNGATVNIDIVRKADVLTITAKTHALSGKDYTYVTRTSGLNAEKIGAFLFVELAHLDVTATTVTAADDEETETPIEGELVGLVDNSTPWWSSFSSPATLLGSGSIHFTFKNYTDGINNWDNWLAVFSSASAVPSDVDYNSDNELLIIRSDAYGWGKLYDGCTMENNIDWDNFKTDMDGADVDLTITRNEEQATLKAVTTTAAGKEINYTVNIPAITSESLSVFLTVEGGHLVITSAEVTPDLSGITAVGADTDTDTYYNLQGVKMSGKLPAGLYLTGNGRKLIVR